MQAVEGDGAQGGTAVPDAAFECRLTGLTAQSSYKGSTVWSPCSSSPAFPNLQDGDYTFSARINSNTDAQNDTVAASNFTVDTTAPTLWVLLAFLSRAVILIDIYMYCETWDSQELIVSA